MNTVTIPGLQINTATVPPRIYAMPKSPKVRTIEELIIGNAPATWTNEEFDRVIAARRSNEYSDIQDEISDAISDKEYYDQEDENEREDAYYQAHPEQYAYEFETCLTAYERNR